MASGISRKVDQLGRVVLPAELRRELGIRVGDLVEISVDEERIVLQKVAERCVFCGAAAPGTDLREFRDKLVCESCVEKLSASGA